MRRSQVVEIAVSLDDIEGLLLVYTYTPELGWDDGELGLTEEAPEHWRHLGIVDWLESAYLRELRRAVETQCPRGIGEQVAPVGVCTRDLCARKFSQMKKDLRDGA